MIWFADAIASGSMFEKSTSMFEPKPPPPPSRPAAAMASRSIPASPSGSFGSTGSLVCHLAAGAHRTVSRHTRHIMRGIESVA